MQPPHAPPPKSRPKRNEGTPPTENAGELHGHYTSVQVNAIPFRRENRLAAARAESWMSSVRGSGLPALPAGAVSTSRLVPCGIAALKRCGCRASAARQRLDCVAILRVEVHVLAPAARVEHESPRPSRLQRRQRRLERQMRFFAGPDDGERAV